MAALFNNKTDSIPAQHANAIPAPAPAPYTAKEAADFARQGACMVAMPPDEVWRDISLEGSGHGKEDTILGVPGSASASAWALSDGK
jgi:hypothetical protein